MGAQKGVSGLGWLALVTVTVSLFIQAADADGQVSFQLAEVDRVGSFPDLYEASISELQKGLQNGEFSSVDLVQVSIFLPMFVLK